MPKATSGRDNASPAARSVEHEVAQNILRQPFGSGTVADLNLPAEFIRRCADRVIISSFNDRYRVVVGEQPARAPVPPPPPGEAAGGLVRIIEGRTRSDRRWADAPMQTAAVLRGLRFPEAQQPDPPELPGASAPYELRRAAALIAKSLARDGLARTALDAAIALRPLLKPADGPEALASLLGAAGTPTDLLAMLELPGVDGFAPGQCVPWLHARLTGEVRPRPAALREALSRAQLRFHPTLPGFCAADDAAANAPLVGRMQLTRADDWIAPGDGGSLDLARQVARALPALPLILSAREDHAPIIAQHAAAWSHEAHRTAPITVIAEGVIVSQWAQDNARAGKILRDGSPVPAALLPRYASRTDELTALVPGDSALAESLRAAGVEVARSPLHFQGGNTLLVTDPATSRRVLLVGESEIYRSIALGLTHAQAVAALQAEFAADEAVILPAASYHIDHEVFCIADPDAHTVHAFVADAPAADRIILRAGIAAMHAAGMMDAATADRLTGSVCSDPPVRNAIEALLGALASEVPAQGGFPIALAAIFDAHTPGESAVGNFLIFLDALDAAASRAGLASELGLHGHASAALAARERLRADSAVLQSRLRELGWAVHAIPSRSAGARSICTLNALRAGENLVLMPSVEGLFRGVAEAASAAIVVACPKLRVLVMNAAESQRRNGAARCSLSLFC